MPVSYGTKAKAKATVLHSKIVRARVGYCERCGSTTNLQCAHIRRRTYSTTRTDLDNAWCLCAKCHWAVDQDASEFMELVRHTIGVRKFNALKKKSLEGVGTKVDWPAELERLKAIWADVEATA